MKVAIIGNENTVLPLKSLGIEIFNIATEKDGAEILTRIRNTDNENDNYAVVFITSDWYKKLETEITKFKNKILPAIISLPSPAEKQGATLAGLEKMMERAIGSKLIIK